MQKMSLWEFILMYWSTDSIVQLARDSPTIWCLCAFFLILLQSYVPFYVKKEKMGNSMCLLEFECAKRLKAHSQAIPGWQVEVLGWHFIWWPFPIQVHLDHACKHTLIERFMGPTWDPSGADRTQVAPMLAPWTLLSGYATHKNNKLSLLTQITTIYWLG